MNVDFRDAHDRHYEDAQALFRSNRWANADHLFGLSVECGLKRLMLEFGMPWDGCKDRPAEQHDRFHADQAWTRYVSYQSGHHAGAAYALPSATNPFGDWNINQRYVGQPCFDLSRVQVHQQAAAAVHDLLRKAELEGLI